MSDASKLKAADLDIPAECKLLRAKYKKSGLTVAELAQASGLSVGTITIVLSGVRYRAGKPHVSIPPDGTLVKVASVLRVQPAALRDAGRERAADLLAQAIDAGSVESFVLASDLDAQAVAAGRQALARQVLAVFSTEELRAEVQRRDAEDEASQERDDQADLLDDLRTSQYPG